MVRIRRHHLAIARLALVAPPDQMTHRPTENRQRRVEDRHAHGEKRHADGHQKRVRRLRSQRQGRDDEADEHRAAVAEEDARRMVVVPEKAQQTSRKGEVEQRLLRILDQKQRARHADGRNQRQPRSEPVQSVNQVERIHRPRDPEHGHQTVQPRRQIRPKLTEPKARPGPDQHGHDQLPRQLHLRRQTELVVRQT